MHSGSGFDKIFISTLSLDIQFFNYNCFLIQFFDKSTYFVRLLPSSSLVLRMMIVPSATFFPDAWISPRFHQHRWAGSHLPPSDPGSCQGISRLVGARAKPGVPGARADCPPSRLCASRLLSSVSIEKSWSCTSPGESTLTLSSSFCLQIKSCALDLCHLRPALYFSPDCVSLYF